MSEVSKKTTPEAPTAAEPVSVPHVPLVEKDAPPEPEKVEKPVAEEVVEGDKEKAVEENKITESTSFKEESNKVDDLIDPEKKALDEFKQLIKEALQKHEFTAPPPPPASTEEEKKEREVAKPEEQKEEEEKKPEEPKVVEKKSEETEVEEKKPEEPKAEEKKPAEAKVDEKKPEEPKVEKKKPEEPKVEEKKPQEAKVEEKKPEEPKVEEKKPEEPKVEEVKAKPPQAVEAVKEKVAEEKATPPPAAETSEAVEKKVEEKAVAAEEIKETIVHEVTTPVPLRCEEPAAVPAAEDEKPKQEETASPEEVSIWGIPLLADERSDVVLLKFLRARDFKVKDAFAMLKNVVAWRKSFKIDELLEEEVGEGLEKVVYTHGVDKEGHPVCYNAFGEFHDKELYSNTFADADKRAKFLRFYIKFLEKNIRKLDFSPDGICTIVQITDLKNSPGLILFKKELRQATNQALQLLQDNYPEFVAKQVFINVPWWYVAYNRMISPFLTQRTKSKFVFAGPTRTAETLCKYIAPEQVPVQYFGLSKGDGQEFTAADTATEVLIKPASQHIVELPITEACILVWEVRVVGWDVSYSAEFVPNAEDRYTWIVHKARKVGAIDEQVISCNFKIGETGKVVLTLDNQTSKKKKLFYRSKTKPSE